MVASQHGDGSRVRAGRQRQGENKSRGDTRAFVMQPYPTISTGEGMDDVTNTDMQHDAA